MTTLFTHIMYRHREQICELGGGVAGRLGVVLMKLLRARSAGYVQQVLGGAGADVEEAAVGAAKSVCAELLRFSSAGPKGPAKAVTMAAVAPDGRAAADAQGQGQGLSVQRLYDIIDALQQNLWLKALRSR